MASTRPFRVSQLVGFYFQYSWAYIVRSLFFIGHNLREELDLIY